MKDVCWKEMWQPILLKKGKNLKLTNNNNNNNNKIMIRIKIK